MKGVNRGMRIPLANEKVTIGRSTDNNIVLEDSRISRHHCSIYKSEHKYEIQDLGSTNKTVVNEEAINSKILNIGDKIYIGDTAFLFTTVEDGNKLLARDHLQTGTKVITVTEMKIAPDENKILDVSVLGDNLVALRRAHRDLATIYKIGLLINSVPDSERLMNILADKLMEVGQPDRVVLILFENGSERVANKIVRTRKGDPDDSDVTNISMSIVDEAASERMAILSYDALADERFRDKQSVILNRIRSAICVPIMSAKDVLGVMYVDTKVNVGKFSEYDLQFLSIIANQAGIAIQNAKLYEDLDGLFTGSLRTLVATIEAKDPITSGHSVRVTAYSLAIAEEIRLEKELLRPLKIAALLHDIGKIGVPEAILGKPAPLSQDEFIRIREHAARGAEIVKNIKNVEEVVRTIRHHHERYDGTGIPDALKGTQIPITSRIIAVADTFDAMSSDRPYRKGVSLDKVVKEIQRNSGSQFDPKIVEAFLRAYKKGRLNEIPQTPWA